MTTQDPTAQGPAAQGFPCHFCGHPCAGTAQVQVDGSWVHVHLTCAFPEEPDATQA